MEYTRLHLEPRFIELNRTRLPRLDLPEVDEAWASADRVEAAHPEPLAANGQDVADVHLRFHASPHMRCFSMRFPAWIDRQIVIAA